MAQKMSGNYANARLTRPGRAKSFHRNHFPTHQERWFPNFHSWANSQRGWRLSQEVYLQRSQFHPDGQQLAEVEGPGVSSRRRFVYAETRWRTRPDSTGQSSTCGSTFVESDTLKPTNTLILLVFCEVVAGEGIEPPTQGFSVLLLTVRNCSDKFALVSHNKRFMRHK